MQGFETAKVFNVTLSILAEGNEYAIQVTVIGSGFDEAADVAAEYVGQEFKTESGESGRVRSVLSVEQISDALISAYDLFRFINRKEDPYGAYKLEIIPHRLQNGPHGIARSGSEEGDDDDLDLDDFDPSNWNGAGV